MQLLYVVEIALDLLQDLFLQAVLYTSQYRPVETAVLADKCLFVCPLLINTITGCAVCPLLNTGISNILYQCHRLMIKSTTNAVSYVCENFGIGHQCTRTMFSFKSWNCNKLSAIYKISYLCRSIFILYDSTFNFEVKGQFNNLGD